jgi:glycosyltransferase involved in cell wall biosynthesis
MKIAYILKNYNANSELWAQRQIEILKDDIAFIAASDNKDKKWKKTIPIINLYKDYPVLKKILIRLKIMGKKSPEERYNETLRIHLDKYKVEAIFVNYLTFSHDLQEILISTKLPVIIHTHGYDITWDLFSIEKNKRVYTKNYFDFIKKISKKALFIANSIHSKDRLTKVGIPDEKIIVKPFGVPIEWNVSYIKKNHSLSILYLGRLVDCKAPDLVIQAFEKACDKGLVAKLIIAGDGYLATTCRLLRMRSKYRDRITLLGAVTADEGRKLRSECDIFTAHNCKGPISNQYEAFGVSIIEAMAAGLPVVTGRSGGVIDSVLDNETGFLFSPGNIDQHAEKLLELAKKPELRAKMGRNGLKRVEKLFSIKNEEKSLRCILKLACKQ